MDRMYTVVSKLAFGTPAGDLCRGVAGATEAVRIQSVTVTGITETDDSNEIVMGWATADSTGGTVATGVNTSPSKGAASSIVWTFNPTADATGLTYHWREGMSVLAGFSKIWTPGRGPVIDPTDTFFIAFTEAWTTDPTLITCIEYDEIG